MVLIAKWIVTTMQHRDDEAMISKVADEVRQHASTFPVPGLDLLGAGEGSLNVLYK